MCSIATKIILLASVTHSPAKEFMADRSEDKPINTLVDRIGESANSLVRNSFERAPMTSSLHQTALDDAMLGKQGHLVAHQTRRGGNSVRRTSVSSGNRSRRSRIHDCVRAASGGENWFARRLSMVQAPGGAVRFADRSVAPCYASTNRDSVVGMAKKASKKKQKGTTAEFKGFGAPSRGQGFGAGKGFGTVAITESKTQKHAQSVRGNVAPAPQASSAPAVTPAPQTSTSPVVKAPRAQDIGQILNGIDEEQDVFWQLIPHILSTEFPPAELTRVLDLVRFARGELQLDSELISNPWRPHGEIHAYMPGIPASPWHDPSLFEFTAELEAKADVIRAEFQALMASSSAQFQSVTEMNYDAGWQTLVLYYNSAPVPGFPYHLCPVTKSILDKIPVAGRIAGFNRQKPGSGIPLHSDGNNMWLTAQMGVALPSDASPWIRVGPEKREWQVGKCLVYDTTYEHETFNPSTTEERIVLHVDFWNYKQLSPVELAAMQKVYALRQKFLEAEGVSSVSEKRLGSM